LAGYDPDHELNSLTSENFSYTQFTLRIFDQGLQHWQSDSSRACYYLCWGPF